MDAGQKFLFDTSFDPERLQVEEVPSEPELPPEPPAPTFSEAELQAARQDGFAQGLENGRQEALESIEQTAAAALQSAVQQAAGLIAAQDAAQEAQRQSALCLALKAVETLFPTLRATQGLAEIETAIADAIRGLEAEPRVVVRTSETVVDHVGERLNALAAQSGYEGRLLLLPDPELAADAVRVEWASGGAERDCTGLWETLRQRIETHLHGEDAPSAQADAPDALSDETVTPEPAEPPSAVDPDQAAPLAEAATA